jgi:hypothetical protein
MRSSTGSGAIKHRAVDIGAVVGHRDPEGMQATRPKGSGVNPCVKRSGTTLGLLEFGRPEVGRLYVVGDLECKSRISNIGWLKVGHRVNISRNLVRRLVNAYSGTELSITTKLPLGRRESLGERSVQGARPFSRRK